ncbi:MAG: acyl-CoA dehydratase activase-related protein [Patescibacteria group bacterium]|nr:acyl-CoA dehydratase activase-related protein [Patescibacteria group bacterium]
MTIGIARALIYWKRPYFWENFFENLGFQVLVSPETNKEIVEWGVKVSDPENCFSNKVYWGHLVWLDGKCNLIFVPRLKATEDKLEYCPKFFGLPDLAKILVKTPILTETFDPRKEKTEKTFKKLGKKLKKDNREIKKAFEISLLKEKELKEKENREFFEKIHSEKQKIILISHPYNLYDEYVNLRIKEKLEKLGAEPILIDKVPLQNQKSKMKNQKSKVIDFHWEFGREIMEKIQEILKYKISGAIEVSSFACGCDAVLKEFVAKEFKERKIPFLYLIIDEHTGEAGFQTRLEAFLDTLK